jgi:hypothetical protein
VPDQGKPLHLCGRRGVSFDCCHSGDAPDPELQTEEQRSIDAPYARMYGHIHRAAHDVVRDQAYVEAECRRLCDQASEA